MEKHTPAPWKAVKGADDEPERWMVVADGEREFHIATIDNGQPGDCLDTEAATARVMAAAPELLEALKTARGVLAVACGETAPYIKQAFAVIDHAIYKAEIGL